MKVISFFKSTGMAGIIAIAISILFVVTSVHAATTISTILVTGGSLNASTSAAVGGAITTYSHLYVNGFATTTGTNGNFATAGNINATGTLAVTGVTEFYGDINVNGFATTTAASGNFATAGNINATGTLAVTGVTSHYGNVNVNGFATTTAASGNFATAGTLTSVGAVWASSTLQATSDAVFYGGVDAINLTTTNSATSSAIVGCITTYPTSTSNPVKLVFYATTSLLSMGIQSAAGTVGTNVSGTGGAGGLVLFAFGACS